MAYDALNRMIRKDFPGSTSTNCALTSLSGSVFSGYDLLNRLTYAYFNSTSGTGVAYTYDALSRTTTEAEVAGTLSYQYDLAGDLTQMTWPDGFYAGYAYDNLARVITINANGATSGLGVLGQYSYNDLGQITGAAYGNGASTSQTFDGFHRLNTLTQSFTGSSVAFTYAYNPAGQIVSKSASDSGYVSHPGATSVSYTATGVNRYATVGGVTYSYDGRQNLTSDGTRTFTYDSENKLLTGSAPTSATYTYDPLGRLQTQATGSTITYLNAGSMMVGEYGASGITVRPIPIPGANAWVTFYNGSGTSSPTWVAADELGSIINFSNSSGAGTAATGYGAFGEPATWTGAPAFTGQLAMNASQIYNYRARMYDPRLGRFLQTDPAGYGGGDMNLYGYVLNDPINGIDPLGLQRLLPPVRICGNCDADDGDNGDNGDNDNGNNGGVGVYYEYDNGLPFQSHIPRVGTPGYGGSGSGFSSGGFVGVPDDGGPQNTCSSAPGINGIGVSAGVQLDAGLGKRGTVQSESLGLGLFGNGGGPGSLTAGGFRTSIDSTFSPSTAGTNQAFGAVAQGGVSIFATNAHSVRELSGPFKTISGAIGIGAGASFQYSYGGGIWQLSVGFTPLPGAVLGIGGSRTTSNNNVTPVGCRSN